MLRECSRSWIYMIKFAAYVWCRMEHRYALHGMLSCCWFFLFEVADLSIMIRNMQEEEEKKNSSKIIELINGLFTWNSVHVSS